MSGTARVNRPRPDRVPVGDSPRWQVLLTSDTKVARTSIRVDPEVVVVGAGAAGLMAAIVAARSGRRVLVLERTSDGGRKILISGGGRCNVLPSSLAPQRFVTDSSPNTLRNLLRSWPLTEQRRFFEHDLDIPLALEPETGKLFPVSNRARDVRDRLVTCARTLGATFRFDAQAIESRAGIHAGRLLVRPSRG